jgi:SAM-dependent methyltransferase
VFEAWERSAQWWQREFTDGADPEYVEQLLPLAREWLAGFERVLEVGTGEGQVARAAIEAGAATVVGIDPIDAQLATAVERGGGPIYARAVAEHLPVRDGAVDAVVACLVFEHLVEHAPPLAEVARVLRPGGRFVFFLNHPLLQTPQSGWVIDHILEEEYWRIGPYLEVSVTDEELSPGVHIPFVHRPLSHYVNTMAEHGLVLERMEEPAPPPGFIARAGEYEGAAQVPRVLLLVSRRSVDAEAVLPEGS